jgi:ribose 5-phosphate isomerase A
VPAYAGTFVWATFPYSIQFRYKLSTSYGLFREKAKRSESVARVHRARHGRADEANKRLHLIKGGGGALTREKVRAGAARRFVCIVDETKLVGMLGAFPLPVEVLPMAQAFVARKLVKLRAQPIWREGFVTDNGNHILDVHELNINNPLEMETRLNQIPGILTVGIFAHRSADILLIANDTGVREMRA